MEFNLDEEYNKLLSGEIVQLQHEEEVVELCQRLRKNCFDMEKVEFDLEKFFIQIVK